MYELFLGSKTLEWEGSYWKERWGNQTHRGSLTRNSSSVELTIEGLEIPEGAILRTALGEGEWRLIRGTWNDIFNPIETRELTFKGQKYKILKYCKPGYLADRINPDGTFWVSEFRSWTYACFCHKTPEGAIADSISSLTVRQASEMASGISNRADYESACKQFGVAAASDEEIRSSTYGLSYLQIAYPEYTTEQEVRQILTKRMLYLLEAQAKAQVTAPPISKATSGQRCYICSATRNLMAGSLGPLCPDCYDDVEGML
ncbi:MAG TPA: hypothetical protein V6D29_11190 [Leptolyngbyaceae cyanobacterium]